jgi:hypothetical protein
MIVHEHEPFDAETGRAALAESSLTATDAFDVRGFPLGLVALNSETLSPWDGATVPNGPLEVRVYAFAGGERRVARVDVSLDGGATWSQAELLDDLGPWAGGSGGPSWNSRRESTRSWPVRGTPRPPLSPRTRSDSGTRAHCETATGVSKMPVGSRNRGCGRRRASSGFRGSFTPQAGTAAP